MQKIESRYLTKSKILIVLISVLVLVVSITMVQNAVQLREEVNNRTKRYVFDVAIQLTADINERLSKNIVDLEVISDGVLRSENKDAESMNAYLKQKSERMGFTSIIVANTEERIYQTNDEQIEEFYDLPGVQESLNGSSGVSFLNEQSILYSVPIRQDGKVIGVLGGVRNKENMQKLIQTESFSGEGHTCIINHDGDVIISPTDGATFTTINDIFDGNTDETFSENVQNMRNRMKRGQSGIFRLRGADGADIILSYNPLDSYDWVLLTLVPSNVISVKIDRYTTQTLFIVIGCILLMICILTILLYMQRVHYKQMTKAAFVDRLTGKMSNTAFQIKCETVITKAPPNTYSIVLLNIKNFKYINTHFGSEAGDETLRYCLEILEKQTEGVGFVTRAEADNFFICLRQGNPQAIQETINQIVQHVNQEIKYSEFYRNLSYYFVLQPGVYIVDNPSLSVTVMQDNAKIACRNRTDAEDGVCKFYDSAFVQKMEREQELNGLFEQSLANRDFQVYLQPKVWLSNEKVGGAEALIRWQHPERGIIFPSDFIPLFEQNGNICKLDLYVFEEVCKMIHRWQREGKKLFPISVNLSRMHFLRPNFLEPFAKLAKTYEIPDGILEFELTESIFFDEQGIEAIKSSMQEMQRLGFRCSLDDFGSGYSSLGMLMEFDVDVLKLDRRFFKDMNSKKTQDLISSVTELSRKMGAIPIAEGIETTEQLDILKKLNCDAVQGYVYAKPMPIREFEEWLEKRGEMDE